MKGKDTLLVPMTHEGEYNGKGVVGYKNLHFSSFEIVRPPEISETRQKLYPAGSPRFLYQILIADLERVSAQT